MPHSSIFIGGTSPRGRFPPWIGSWPTEGGSWQSTGRRPRSRRPPSTLTSSADAFVTHGRIEPYTVLRTGWADPAFTVGEPFTVTDELYIHRYEKRRDRPVRDRDHRRTASRWSGPGSTAGAGSATSPWGTWRRCSRDNSVRQIISDALSFIVGLDREGKQWVNSK